MDIFARQQTLTLPSGPDAGRHTIASAGFALLPFNGIFEKPLSPTHNFFVETGIGGSASFGRLPSGNVGENASVALSLGAGFVLDKNLVLGCRALILPGVDAAPSSQSSHTSDGQVKAQFSLTVGAQF